MVKELKKSWKINGTVMQIKKSPYETILDKRMKKLVMQGRSVMENQLGWCIIIM